MDGTSSATPTNLFTLDWKLLLEYLRVVIWPLIVTTFIIYFRKNIAFLIDRITIIKGPGGTEVRADDQKRAQAQEGSTKQAPQEEIEKIIKPQIDQIKKNYEEELAKEKRNKEEVVNYLLDQLSIKDLEIEFEKIYRLIFGSQIALLRTLTTNRSMGSTREDLLLRFVLLQRTWSVFQGWTLDQYLSFLITNKLVEITRQGAYILTDKGRVFLAYIDSLGYSSDKGL